MRTYSKDHLKEHGAVTLAVTSRLAPPKSDDVLIYWTHHADHPCEVDLTSFAHGQKKSKHKKGGGIKFRPFSGRPELIRQLCPAIQEILLYATEKTVSSYLMSLREWWRILDAVEEEAEAAGNPIKRVDDVRLLTHVHSQLAKEKGVNRKSFGNFRALVDTTLVALGKSRTYWESPEDSIKEKRIPPQSQRDELRFEVRNSCRRVLELWDLSDRLSRTDNKPTDPFEFIIWRNTKYYRFAQKESGKVIPSPADLKDPIPSWAYNTRGNFESSLWRSTIFPTHRDADAVWHQCLLNTGWNSSTLTYLDASKNFLIDHFKDDAENQHRRFVLSPQTYDLIGNKGRSPGKEQIITGQWKSLDAPGHLIKTYLARVEPLRELLKEQLTIEMLKYEQMSHTKYEELTAQFAKIKKLEQGIRSVWLYVNHCGNVSWISDQLNKSGFIQGYPATYLEEIIYHLNQKRDSKNVLIAKSSQPFLQHIPHVRPKDFRVWFSDYVYRTSFGNMLQVKKALNHTRTQTSANYVNTHTLNQESSNSARYFLNILVKELDTGRVDLTMLAHLYRHGNLTPEQEGLLTQARALPKSRMKIGCKDARHPPSHIKATPNGLCDVQRCMLCLEHAVLMPESLDGIAMRVEELRALQSAIPLEMWIEEMYDLELKNNLLALHGFDINQSLIARKKWAQAIAQGTHYVPGIPLSSSFDFMELT